MANSIREMIEMAQREARQDEHQKTEQATFNTLVERMISQGYAGPAIVSLTGFDQTQINEIAKGLGKQVAWA